MTHTRELTRSVGSSTLSMTPSSGSRSLGSLRVQVVEHGTTTSITLPSFGSYLRSACIRGNNWPLEAFSSAWFGWMCGFTPLSSKSCSFTRAAFAAVSSLKVRTTSVHVHSLRRWVLQLLPPAVDVHLWRLPGPGLTLRLQPQLLHALLLR